MTRKFRVLEKPLTSPTRKRWAEGVPSVETKKLPSIFQNDPHDLTRMLTKNPNSLHFPLKKKGNADGRFLCAEGVDPTNWNL